MIPTWEFGILGKILFYLIISFGILHIILNLKECFNYIERFPYDIEAESKSQDVMNANLAKFFLLNMFINEFDSKYELTSGAVYRIDQDSFIDCNSYIKNSNCNKIKLNLSLNSLSNRFYSSSESFYGNSEKEHNRITDCWIILFNSFLLICSIISIKVIQKIFNKFLDNSL